MQYTIRLDNIGDEDAEDVVYKVRIPEKISILGGKDFVQQGRYLIWRSGIIYAAQNKTLSYKLKAVNYADEKLKVNLSYVYVGHPLQFTLPDLRFIAPTKLNIKEPFHFYYDVENLEEDGVLHSQIHFYVPIDVTVLSYSPALEKIGNNEFLYDHTLNPGAKDRLDIRIQSFYTGDYNLSVKGTFEINDRHFYEEKNLVAKVEIPKVSPSITSNKYDISAGESFILNAYLENNDIDNDYYLIDAVLQSEIFKEDIVIQDLGYVDVYHFEKEYWPPLYDDQKKLQVNFSGTYQSLSGEKFSFYTQRDIIVGPVNKSFSIDQIISKTQVEKGQNFSVKIIVKNLRDDTAYNIKVFDEFPDDLTFLQGVVREQINLIGNDKKSGGDDEKQAYAYLLQVPLNYPKASIDITTSISYTLGTQEYTRKLVSTLTLVDPPRINDTVVINDTVIIDNTTNSVNNTKPDEKPDDEQTVGWFASMINSIGDFFRNFFT